jgi:hypothetical protein
VKPYVRLSTPSREKGRVCRGTQKFSSPIASGSSPQKSLSPLSSSSARSASGLPPQLCPASALPLLCSCAAPPHQSQRAPPVGLLCVRAPSIDGLHIKPAVSLLISLRARAAGRRPRRQAHRRPPCSPPRAHCRRSATRWMEPHRGKIRGGERTRTEGGAAAPRVLREAFLLEPKQCSSAP